MVVLREVCAQQIAALPQCLRTLGATSRNTLPVVFYCFIFQASLNPIPVLVHEPRWIISLITLLRADTWSLLWARSHFLLKVSIHLCKHKLAADFLYGDIPPHHSRQGGPSEGALYTPVTTQQVPFAFYIRKSIMGCWQQLIHRENDGVSFLRWARCCLVWKSKVSLLICGPIWWETIPNTHSWHLYHVEMILYVLHVFNFFTNSFWLALALLFGWKFFWLMSL